MSAVRPVSVVVVSRGRPRELHRCLTGLGQLDYSPFEIVVVADPAGLAAVTRAGMDGRVKQVEFDEANISAARNLGIGQAAGEVVAFIDDDAVPEPTWLTHLAAPFAAPGVAAAGGYVRGRNGISYQHTGRRVDSQGRHSPLRLEGTSPEVFAAEPGVAIKTEGTNCAFRAEVLFATGGFDPAFRFYMDETDLNLRLADAEQSTAIVPLAQVHHGFAASDRRNATRVPRSLHEIGASTVVLLRKRVPPAAHARALAALEAEQRARLLRHMVAGTCEPRDVARLMDTLTAGIADGKSRLVRPLHPMQADPPPFLAFTPTVPFTGNDVLCGRIHSRRRLRRLAAVRVREGRRVSLFLFSPTTLFHRVRFNSGGYWEQRGGLFGKADRSDPKVRFYTLGSRRAAEIARVATVRGLAG